MPKNILIFSDGTGQIGGIRPDQRLSNVYKLYRAMRPGPSSPIKPSEQVAFYDPGLGAGETDGITFKRIRNMLEAAVGTGIDDNIIDCYEKIISYYEPGDRVLLFGFSRGAYTARCVANVMNLCGIPMKMPDGSAVPRYGPKLREVATEAVKDVYNHGAGYNRGLEPFLDQREEKGQRFRAKYGSSPVNDEDVQGNVQPTFIGVFDTVAALGDKVVSRLVGSVSFVILLSVLVSYRLSYWYFFWPLFVLGVLMFCWYLRVRLSQIKIYSPDAESPLKWYNPMDWTAIYKNSHRAAWNRKNYDKWLDFDVGFARHALAIDEHRADFPRVKWATADEEEKNANKNPQWLKQVWFPGCHSDIGGSYLEPESRLSDITLDWMVEELRECVPEVQIRDDKLVRSPDALALQHEETYMVSRWPFYVKWKVGPRILYKDFSLHSSVFERLEAPAVPQLGDTKPYRPEQLKMHPRTKKYYLDDT